MGEGAFIFVSRVRGKGEMRCRSLIEDARLKLDHGWEIVITKADGGACDRVLPSELRD